MTNQKGISFELKTNDLIRGFIAATIFFLGFYLFLTIIQERISFTGANPRRDRAVVLMVAICLLVSPSTIMNTNKKGLTGSIGVFIAIYLAMAFLTGTPMIFAFTGEDFYLIASGIKILAAPVLFVMLMIVLLYFGVSDKLWMATIYVGVSMGYMVLAMQPFVGILA